MLILILLVILAIMIILSLWYNRTSFLPERFDTISYPYRSGGPSYGSVYPVVGAGYADFPFWEIQSGTTRNMSYDIRGDVPIKKMYTGPWLQSSQTPIYNRPLVLGYSV